jgi:hypothetical protein
MTLCLHTGRSLSLLHKTGSQITHAVDKCCPFITSPSFSEPPFLHVISIISLDEEVAYVHPILYIGLSFLKESTDAILLTARSGGEEIPRRSWNPNVHYRVHNRLPLTLLESDESSRLPTCLINIYFNIMLPSTLRTSEWYLPLSLSNRNFVRISYLTHAPRI